MKFPKNRANLYLVARSTYAGLTAIVGGFSELSDADEYRAACEQEWLDKVGGVLTGVSFDVVMTTYYG